MTIDILRVLLSMWYRIFCKNVESASPTNLLNHLQVCGLNVLGDFRGSAENDWSSGELKLGLGSPVYIERYLTDGDDLRNDLNTWAAFLETCDYSPNSTALMERVIQTEQLITLRKPIDHADEIKIDRLCLEGCRFIAQHSDGIYQIDDDGWYAADGTLLVKEY